MRTHLAIATTALGVIDEIEIPTGTPGAGEVLVEVEYSTITAPDVYTTDFGFFFVQEYPARLGMNAAGTVVEVGPDVHDLQIGDRVVAFAFQSQQAKALQQYAMFSELVVAKVPLHLPLQSAVTFPDNFVTAFWVLFDNLALPFPSALPATTPPPLASSPILIYGGGASVAQYTIQLLHLAGYTQIISAASPKHHAYLRTLGATHTFNYADPKLLATQVRNVAGGPVKIALDAISAETSLATVARMVEPGSKVVALLPFKEGSSIAPPPGKHMTVETPEKVQALFNDVDLILVNAFKYLSNSAFGARLMPSILPELLASGVLKPNHVRLINQGSFKQRTEIALDLVRNNAVSSERVVVDVRP